MRFECILNIIWGGSTRQRVAPSRFATGLPPTKPTDAGLNNVEMEDKHSEGEHATQVLHALWAEGRPFGASRVAEVLVVSSF